jgi:hypothetical protein
MNAAAIASGIDTSTVAGHNLRALLLRLLDDEPGQGFFNIRANAYSPDGLRIDIAVGDLVTLDRGARMGGFVVLTPLGREVAERLRPVPWRMFAVGCDVALTRPDGTVRTFGDPGPSRDAYSRLRAEAERIAALLTADDLAQAKAYRSEPG